MGSLFPCLPDEIGWKCLLKVELNSHHNLRCVSKSWNDALKSPHFYQERKRLMISEQRICMLQNINGICNGVAVYDLAKNSCKNLPPVPAEINGIFHCHFVKQKLVLISDLLPDSTRRCVWLYDFACSKWRQGAKMPTWLNKFASAADEQGGLIYVGGGYTNFHDNDADYRRYGYPVRNASVYNVEEDKWDFLPDMNTKIADCSGVYVDGKFYVVYSQAGIFFQVFDSYTRSWKSMANRWYKMVNEFGRVCPLSAYGRLFCLSGRGLIEYDYSEDKMHFRGPGPSFMEERSRINFAIEVGHNIFVSSLNRFLFHNFATEVGHNNFMRSLDLFHCQKFCKLAPPSETGGAFKWIGIERPSGLQGMAVGAATLDL
ncbi:hypothetical protein SUGI_0255620 [Cryptomeria japonica]|uniref:F-box/kelch-repeat protein At1g15670 n=1 Tax=Cryptomeria japonica TaxID=3369 RepID=UPI002408DE75|nr:F-box/kelch-repeat protein At1g15670 [Cryptomeria japonica]GLJ15560.1 hypothetical protein SUGI_0255620 [Cryptomeria japonica]